MDEQENKHRRDMGERHIRGDVDSKKSGKCKVGNVCSSVNSVNVVKLTVTLVFNVSLNIGKCR